MSIRVEQLSEILDEVLKARESSSENTDEFAFWYGASGECYVHSVFSLTDCPELPQVNFLLVSSGGEQGEVVHVGQTTDRCQSLNRAHVRQLGAQLGASEVHIHFLGSDVRDRSVVAFDLETALSHDADEAVVN